MTHNEKQYNEKTIHITGGRPSCNFSGRQRRMLRFIFEDGRRGSVSRDADVDQRNNKHYENRFSLRSSSRPFGDLKVCCSVPWGWPTSLLA